ncbi:MAG: hypothetical protein KAJ19_07760, partial [Gammaproteobacteria bacterium]|nr:hypothetical protein [Gammaproteobacteria bacterium]
MKRIIKEYGLYYVEVLARETYRGRMTQTPERWDKVDDSGNIVTDRYPIEYYTKPVSFHSLELAEAFVEKMEIRAEP